MAEIVVNDMRQGYIDLINLVLEEGEEVSPRGMLTKEVRNATIVLTDPINAIPVGVGRKLNMKIGAVETTQLVAGVSSAMQLNIVSNNKFEAYMNNGRLLGAYGPRLYSQLEDVITALTRDPDTRQAAALVWRGNELMLANMGNKDVPCTVMLAWNIRNGKLNATTTMRSNDVFLGVAYDFWMFTRLQMTLAWALGLEVGDYRHHAVSLHAYERDWEKAKDLRVTDDEFRLPGGYTDGKPVLGAYSEVAALNRWRQARGWAEDVVFGRSISNPSESVSWYATTLADHASTGTLCPSCRYCYPTMGDDADSIRLARACTNCKIK